MKNKIFLLIGLLLFCSILSSRSKEDQNNISHPQESSISIFCTPELHKLTSQWAREYCIVNPDVKIEVIIVTESSITENLKPGKNLGFITGELDAEMYESLWKEVVGRDVIVPVFNAGNPFTNEIIRQGISPEEFAQIIVNPEMRNWGTLFNTQQNAPVNIYMTDDESINSGLEKLFNLNQIKFDGIKVEDAETLISSVQNDKYSIGLCKITNIIDFGNHSFLENIKILPIDRNNNGEIDYMENIYDDLNVLSRAGWIGKYPKALSNNIYSVSYLKPANKTELAFLTWVLTDGQQYLNNYGYSDLVQNERVAKVNLLVGNEIDISTRNSYAIAKDPLFFYTYFPILLTFIIAVVIMVIWRVKYKKDEKEGIPDMISVPKLIFNTDFIESPPGLFYDKTHTWAFMEKDGMVKIGIDDFLQHITGPITSVKMKYPGERIRKGKQVLSIIQNGKQLDIYASVSGTIKEQNIILNKNTSIINSSPYSKGWIYKIEPTNWLKEIQFLIMGNRYKEWLKSEFSRLKDFIAASVKSSSSEYAHVLQDGGELKDGILEDLGPRIWEDFQTNFIDVSS